MAHVMDGPFDGNTGPMAILLHFLSQIVNPALTHVIKMVPTRLLGPETGCERRRKMGRKD